MNSEHPPFDPPYVSIQHAEQGTAYVETLADGTTRQVSAAEANWVQPGTADAANSREKPDPSSPKSAAGASSGGKVFLKVPFAEKDQAKALGARWDATQKKWYVPHGVDVSLFTAWLPDSLK